MNQSTNPENHFSAIPTIRNEAANDTVSMRATSPRGQKNQMGNHALNTPSKKSVENNTHRLGRELYSSEW